MASNSVPKRIDEILALTEEVAAGLKVHQSSIGVLQNTESRVRADLATALAANAAAFAASNTAKECATAQSEADTQCKVFIGGCRKVFSLHLGSRWSPEWRATGFPANSTAVPTALVERQSLVGALGQYLVAHPDCEHGSGGITAARAAEVFEALSAARIAANAANSVAREANDALQGARQALRARLSGLVSELGQLIGDEDSRWYAFGLHRPADPARPAVPENLQLSAGKAGSVDASWSPARRATRYRVYVKEAGETEFTARLSTGELQATVEALGTSSLGGSVWIRVAAANDGGESAACEAVEIVVNGVILAGRAA